jgi:membrane protein
MNTQTIWGLLKNTFSEWNEDKAPRLAAALAYYALFAIAPLLIIAIAIAAWAFNQEQAAVRGQILGQIQGLVGEQGGKAIQDMLAGAASKPATGLFATVAGLVTLVFGAIGVFGQLQDALNTIWEVAPKPGRSWMDMIKDRLAPFTMVLGIAFLLLVSLVVSAVLAAVSTFLGGMLPDLAIVGQVISFVVSFGVITLLFAMIYKLLPDVKIAWSDVWIGAAVTALLFTIGRLLIGLYLGRSSTASTYGAAGSLVIVLIWVYYSAQILFLGAEFTQVYAKAYGSKIQPAENAVAVTEEARAQQGIPRKEQVEAEAGLERQVGGADTARAEAGLERQVGGTDIARAEADRGTDSQALEPERKAGTSAVAAFFLGLVLGRRQRQK